MSRSKLRKSTCTQTCVSKKRPWHGWLRRTLSQGDIGLTMLYFHSSKLSDYAASTRRFDPFPQGNAGRRGIIRRGIISRRGIMGVADIGIMLTGGSTSDALTATSDGRNSETPV